MPFGLANLLRNLAISIRIFGLRNIFSFLI